MALSNIFVEPRREITESVVGVLIAAAVLVPDYRICEWLLSRSHAADDRVLVIPMMLLGLIVLGFAVACVFFLHFIGETTCDWFAERGLRLRPKTRYRIDHYGKRVACQ